MATRRELPWCPTPCPSGLGGLVPRLLDSRTLHHLGLGREGWREVRTSLVDGKMRSDYPSQIRFWLTAVHAVSRSGHSSHSTGSCLWELLGKFPTTVTSLT